MLRDAAALKRTGWDVSPQVWWLMLFYEVTYETLLHEDHSGFTQTTVPYTLLGVSRLDLGLLYLEIWVPFLIWCDSPYIPPSLLCWWSFVGRRENQGCYSGMSHFQLRDCQLSNLWSPMTSWCLNLFQRQFFCFVLKGIDLWLLLAFRTILSISVRRWKGGLDAAPDLHPTLCLHICGSFINIRSPLFFFLLIITVFIFYMLTINQCESRSFKSRQKACCHGIFQSHH